MNDIKVSVIIPCRNEEKYIRSCIESIKEQDYPKDLMEVIVVDGASEDKTVDILSKYSWIKVLHNRYRKVPYAMNQAIKVAQGDYIIRMDAHSTFPNNYISILIRRAIEFKSDNIGTLCFTDVKSKTETALAIKEVLSNKFGVGNSLFRVGCKEPTIVDTVPFGCFKKDVFEKYGLYDEKLDRNQDIELNKRITEGGGLIYLIPEIHCTYYARDKFMDFCRSNYGNGFWNILTVFFTGKISSLSIRHFIPVLFLLSLILPLLFMVLLPEIGYLSLLSFIIYFIFIATISLKLTLKKNLSFFYLVISFLGLHISYGIGSLFALFKLIKL
ncbi:MAG: glycosyltransferase family 2 protein [Hyphomicrobiales bacterium]